MTCSGGHVMDDGFPTEIHRRNTSESIASHTQYLQVATICSNQQLSVQNG